jgi:hypothetical protein
MHHAHSPPLCAVTMDRAAPALFYVHVSAPQTMPQTQGARRRLLCMFNACAHTHIHPVYIHHPLVRAARIVSCEKLPARCVC